MSKHPTKLQISLAACTAIAAASCSVLWARTVFGTVMGERLAKPTSPINLAILGTAIVSATLFFQLLLPIPASKLLSCSRSVLFSLLSVVSVTAVSLALMTLLTFVFSIRIC